MTVQNAAPKATISGPDAGSTVTLSFRAADAPGGPADGDVDWGDGKSEPIAGGRATSATPTQRRAPHRHVRGRDPTAARARATRAPLAVAARAGHARADRDAHPVDAAGVRRAVPAPWSPTRHLARAGHPRCIRAADLRPALAAQTIKVQLLAHDRGRSSSASPLAAARAASPSARRPRAWPRRAAGKRVPGVYSPFSGRAVTCPQGRRTRSTLAPRRAQGGKALKPGTYLLDDHGRQTSRSSARTRMWVLAVSCAA